MKVPGSKELAEESIPGTAKAQRKGQHDDNTEVEHGYGQAWHGCSIVIT